MMTDRSDPAQPVAGNFNSSRSHWSFAQSDGMFDVWTHDDITAADFGAAVRRLSALHGVKANTVRVRMLPPSSEVLGAVQTEIEVREEYDEALQQALRLLGVADIGREMCSYGMPSEYRVWLGYARLTAEEFRRGMAGDMSESPLWDLAAEVMIGTSAVAFSMRFGHTALPFTTAVALQGLRSELAGLDVHVDGHAEVR
jgi:hypothetical protein